MGAKRDSTLDSNKNIAWLYILPMLVMTVFFWIVPIIVAIIISFTNYTGLNTPSFIEFENYKKLASDDLFFVSLKNTLIFVITVVPGQTILGFCVAAWIDRKGRNPVTSFVRWSMFIPSLASVSIIGIVCRVLLNNVNSPLNTFLRLFGIKGNHLLGSGKSALCVLIVLEILISSGYYMVIYLAALTEVPRSYYEAAKMDGLSIFTIYCRVTLPIIWPTTLMILFMETLKVIQSFDLVYTVTGGGPATSTYTLMLYLYMYGFKYSKISMASAIGTVIIVAAGIIVLINGKFLFKKRSNMY